MSVRSCVTLAALCMGLSGHPVAAQSGSNRAISESGQDIDTVLGEGGQISSISALQLNPTGEWHAGFDRFSNRLYTDTKLRVGIDLTTVYQFAPTVLPGTDQHAMALDYDILTRWDLVNSGHAWPGSLYFALEQRLPITSTPPARLRNSIGSVMGTVDGFNDQPLTVTNAFWRQGRAEDGLIYQVGRMAPDGIINVSRFNNPNDNFFALGLVGSGTISFPGHGFGAAAVAYPRENIFVTGTIVDANGRKTDWGNIDAGEFFSALEIGYKPNFNSAYEGRHALTVWHVDARSATGLPSGHGYAIKLEQELTASGSLVGMLRYSQSDGGASLYENQGSAYLVFDNIGHLDGDLGGVAIGFADPVNAQLRREHLVEAFYRFPLTAHADLSLDLQLVFDPANNPQDVFASVFGLRVRETF